MCTKQYITGHNYGRSYARDGNILKIGDERVVPRLAIPGARFQCSCERFSKYKPERVKESMMKYWHSSIGPPALEIKGFKDLVVEDQTIRNVKKY
ncbi:hypothetical protein E2C01_046679 [Portunus trituberculatus]|uniref:Uncharacterized protein n=1 Tax=Portunus trituberculatus TaxID=210409 RepID=A0A5B7FZ73_PORTR|nr:hypothetical protein [Portunus trituberculatus]